MASNPKSSSRYVDPDGKIIAEKGQIVAPPWTVVESKKFAGRFYFFNNETNLAEWSLPKSLVSKKKVSAGSDASDDEDSPKVDDDPLNLETMDAALPKIPSKAKKPPQAARRRLSKKVFPKVGSGNHLAAQAASEEEVGPPPFVVLNGLGQGGYGVVVEVKHTLSGEHFAMKVVCKKKLARARDRERLRLELEIMNNMKPSPFTQQCYHTFETVTSVFMVIDLQLGGDLFYHLMKRMQGSGDGFKEQEVRVILAELTLALEHVHKEGYIHRDVKVENIMLDSSGHVKLIDFGLAYELTGDVTPLTPSGSLIYMAPEMLSEKTGGRHTDWWAMGVLCFELLSGSSPWSSFTERTIIKREIQNLQVLPPPGTSRKAAQFIASLMKKDPRLRLGTSSDSDIKTAPFFSSIDWKMTTRKEAPPAFLPEARCVTPDDNASAMAMYRKLAERSEAVDISMDLRTAEAFPPVAPTTRHPNREKRPSITAWGNKLL